MCVIIIYDRMFSSSSMQREKRRNQFVVHSTTQVTLHLYIEKNEWMNTDSQSDTIVGDKKKEEEKMTTKGFILYIYMFNEFKYVGMCVPTIISTSKQIFVCFSTEC